MNYSYALQEKTTRSRHRSRQENTQCFVLDLLDILSFIAVYHLKINIMAQHYMMHHANHDFMNNWEDESIRIEHLPNLGKKGWNLKNWSACWIICQFDKIAILFWKKKSTELDGLLICISALSTLKENKCIFHIALLQNSSIQITNFNM